MSFGTNAYSSAARMTAPYPPGPIPLFLPPVEPHGPSDPAPQPEGDWGPMDVPWLPIDVPLLGHFGDETREIFDIHPRLPHQPAPKPKPAPGESDKHEEDRSPVAAAAIKASFIGGGIKSALDLGRVGLKLPEAARAGRLSMALRQAALIAPNTNLIDPLAPRVATAASKGMSFTKLDELTYKSSALLGASLSAIQFASSIPNLVDAVNKNGTAGLANTTSGRSGVLQFVGGGVGLGMFGAALIQTRGSGQNLIPRLITASGNPLMTRPWATTLGIGMGVAAMANEIGFFDFMNKDETRSAGIVVRDSTRKLPVVNDPTFRTIALGVGTAGAAAKLVAGYRSTGHLMGGGKAALITGVIGAGLLGAQSLGLLHGIDKQQ